MRNLWINEYQNSNAFYTPYMSHSLIIQNIFFAAYGVIRGPGLSTFEIFDVARGQKRAFCRVAYWELKKFIVTYLDKLTWFYLLTTKDNLLGKVWGKTLLWCEMPWTALTQTESITYLDLNWKYWNTYVAEILCKSFRLEYIAHSRNHGEEKNMSVPNIRWRNSH